MRCRVWIRRETGLSLEVPPCYLLSCLSHFSAASHTVPKLWGSWWSRPLGEHPLATCISSNSSNILFLKNVRLHVLLIKADKYAVYRHVYQSRQVGIRPLHWTTKCHCLLWFLQNDTGPSSSQRLIFPPFTRLSRSARSHSYQLGANWRLKQLANTEFYWKSLLDCLQN